MKDKANGRKAPRSKTGCWTCRERKVRCDEIKPVCSNCSRLGLACAGYGARITFRDDTPRVIQRMEAVTDTHGCYIYDQDAHDETTLAKLRYKTYTTDYFEKYKDIEVEADFHDTHSGYTLQNHIEYSPPSAASQLTPTFLRDLPSPGTDLTNAYRFSGPNPQTPWISSCQQPYWVSGPESQRSSETASTLVSHATIAPLPEQYFSSHFSSVQPAVQIASGRTYQELVQVSPLNQDTSIDSGGSDEPRHLTTQPSIRISSMTNGFDIQDNTGGGVLLEASPNVAGRYTTNVPLFSPDSNLLAPPLLHTRPPRSSDGSDGSFTQMAPSLSSLKWAEHFGGMDVSTAASSIADPEESSASIVPCSLPQALQEFVAMLKPTFGENDQIYLRHFYDDLTAQIYYPDRGANNPFRVLVEALCPEEPALFHAILAFSATDMAHNNQLVDSKISFAEAEQHFAAAQRILEMQLQDQAFVQSTAALATSYFLDMVNVKNCAPLTCTSTVLRIVKARSAAGHIYEGGICWTWFNAILGVMSAIFGGPVLVMPYLIDSDQIPTPGQGNMFPFLKKTEEERKEHTVVSPMYISQLRGWVLLSNLAALATSNKDFDTIDFKESLNHLKLEIEHMWESRARLVNVLTSDHVEELFLTRWTTAIPIAQQVLMAYSTLRLYTELLQRGSYTHDQLNMAVSTIVRIFDAICAADEAFKRRFVLIPIFLCTVMCPDIALRKEIIDKLARTVGTEASWNKALEVANALLQEEMLTKDETGGARGYGTIRWQDVRDRLGGITLF